jgi:hypothetical protein
MTGITNHQIAIIAKLHSHTKHVFGGCFCPDTLPSYIAKYPMFVLCNSDMSWQKGSHWLLLLFPAPETKSEFFDPLGNSISHYHQAVENCLITNGGEGYIANSTCYQPPHSYSCGSFCLWFADMRCLAHTFTECLSYLSGSDLQQNEKLVTTYMSEHMLPTL